MQTEALSPFLIAIPALNEGATIVRVVRECLQYTNHVCVVDDGSSDGTGTLAKDNGAVVIAHESTLGQGASLQTAFEYAARKRFRNVATVDGDGAHAPKHIPGLLAAHIRSGAQLTIGSRLLKIPTVFEMPSPKVAANIFATSLINTLLFTRLSDVASGMRVLSYPFYARKLNTQNFSYAFELISEAIEQECVVNEYPISVRYDASELHCTNLVELTDLLSFCRSKCTRFNTPFCDSISKLISRTSNFEMFKAKCGDYSITALPLNSVEAYIFQVQNPWFDSQIRNEFDIELNGPCIETEHE